MANIKGAYDFAKLLRTGKLVKRLGVARNYAEKRRRRSKRPRPVSRAKAALVGMLAGNRMR